MNGYIIIDCEGLELTDSTKQTLTGIFARVTEAYNTGKPCIAYNCTWDNYKISPISVMINPRPSGNYIATASTLQIEIDPQDGVTVINMLGNQAKKISKGE